MPPLPSARKPPPSVEVERGEGAPSTVAVAAVGQGARRGDRDGGIASAMGSAVGVDEWRRRSASAVGCGLGVGVGWRSAMPNGSGVGGEPRFCGSGTRRNAKSAGLSSVSRVEPSRPPGRRSRLAPAAGAGAGSALQPGAGRRCPSRRRRSRVVAPWMRSATLPPRGRHARWRSVASAIGAKRPASLATSTWPPGRNGRRAERPQRPTGDRRPAGADVDQLEPLERQGRRSRVVELDQLVATRSRRRSRPR